MLPGIISGWKTDSYLAPHELADPDGPLVLDRRLCEKVGATLSFRSMQVEGRRNPAYAKDDRVSCSKLPVTLALLHSVHLGSVSRSYSKTVDRDSLLEPTIATSVQPCSDAVGCEALRHKVPPQLYVHFNHLRDRCIRGEQFLANMRAPSACVYIIPAPP